MPDINLDAVTLTPGPHRPGEGYCIEELVSVLAGEPWSDSPTCVSGLIAAYCRVLNDLLPDEPRQQLKRYAVRQIGTAGDGEAELRRAFLCADYAVRRFAPAALRAAGLIHEAETLEALAPVTDSATARIAARSAYAVADAAADAAAARAAEAVYAAANAAAEAAADAATVAYAAANAAAEAGRGVYGVSAATAAAEAIVRTGQWDDAFVLLEALLTA